MTSPAHPLARLSDAQGSHAQGNRAQNLGLLQILLALLATILGRPRTPARAGHPMPLPADEHPQWAFNHDTGAYGPACAGTHMALEHPMLYAIGPGPNRGHRPHPRECPAARPRIARAPPHLSRPNR